MAAGRFRLDLWARTRVRVAVPPLGERRQDVPAIVAALYRREVAKTAPPHPPAPPPALVRQWQAMDWPDHVRGLERAVSDYMLGLASTGAVTSRCVIPLRATAGEPLAAGVALAKPHLRPWQLDWARIDAAIQRHGGRIGDAAQDLSVDRSTLWRWLSGARRGKVVPLRRVGRPSER